MEASSLAERVTLGDLVWLVKDIMTKSASVDASTTLVDVKAEVDLLSEAVRVIASTASEAPTYWWVGPSVIACSAIVAISGTIYSIKTARDIARKRATLDMIERFQSTEYYGKVLRTFSLVRRDEDGFKPLYAPTSESRKKDRNDVISLLNHYEMMAVGIRAGILDKKTYSTFIRGAFVRDWRAARDFINHIRQPTPGSGRVVHTKRSFVELEDLACEWEREMQAEGVIEKSKDPPQKTPTKN